MTILSYSETMNQDLASLLEQVAEEGEVGIMNKKGQIFIIKLRKEDVSPLDIEGINLGLTGAEIVQFIHESRNRG